MSIARTIKNVVNAVETAEGAGAMVRRSIGVRQAKSFNPFLMFDHFFSVNGGFPEHPHRGQETITLLLHGRIAHEDFTGSKGILYPGDLQFMTAGKGIVHSEMPVPNDDGSPTVGLQLWVDLPHELKNCAPRYRDLREWEVPTVSKQDGNVVVKVISGTSYGVESIKELAYTPMEYYHVKLENDGVFTQEVGLSKNYFLYVLSGGVTVSGTKIDQYQNAFFNQDGTEIVATNLGKPTEFILVGGEVLKQESVQYGPFVAESQHGIEKAFNSYRHATDGFEHRRTWDSLISDGVTQEMIDGPLNGSLAAREKEKQAYLKALNA